MIYEKCTVGTTRHIICINSYMDWGEVMTRDALIKYVAEAISFAHGEDPHITSGLRAFGSDMKNWERWKEEAEAAIIACLDYQKLHVMGNL